MNEWMIYTWKEEHIENMSLPFWIADTHRVANMLPVRTLSTLYTIGTALQPKPKQQECPSL